MVGRPIEFIFGKPYYKIFGEEIIEKDAVKVIDRVFNSKELSLVCHCCEVGKCPNYFENFITFYNPLDIATVRCLMTCEEENCPDSCEMKKQN